MFKNASAFNQDIGGWNTANVYATEGMFSGARAFSQDLSGWCVENINPVHHKDFSNQLMTADQMPHWDILCICTDANGNKTDRCNDDNGNMGCKIYDLQNICCRTWLHGVGCIDSTGLCYDKTSERLCNRNVSTSCSQKETLGGPRRSTAH